MDDDDEISKRIPSSSSLIHGNMIRRPVRLSFFSSSVTDPDPLADSHRDQQRRDQFIPQPKSGSIGAH